MRELSVGGQDLNKIPGLTGLVDYYLNKIESIGIKETLIEVING